MGTSSIVGLECQLPIDLILRTCDGIQIGAHKSSLEQFSEVFPLENDSAEAAVEPPLVNIRLCGIP
jgi:hypothetical protein